MKRFSKLFSDLDQTTRNSKKIALLSNYYKEEKSPEDKLWVTALFTHRRSPRSVSTRLLREWASEFAQIPLWLFEENYHIVGDLAETIALVLPSSSNPIDRSLTYWIKYIMQLKELEEEEKKKKILSAWNQLDSTERFLFNKFITGGFRVGVSSQTIVRALAFTFAQEESVVMHQLMGNWDPGNITWEALVERPGQEAFVSKPYPFYLSYALEEDKYREELTMKTKEWSAEWKWDGMRGQLIKRGGALYLWSRGEELVTDKFPELTEGAKWGEDNWAIDGEILAYGDSGPLDFGYLQTRMGRKLLSKSLLQKVPVKFMAYDLLEYKGMDIRELPLWQRREQLSRLLEQNPSQNILISPQIEFQNWEELSQIRSTARENMAEGLMLKHRDGTYLSGRKKGGMWKWKLDPYSIDVVLLYAQRGHGRRASLFSDFTFAVKDGDKMVPIAKAYSGLTDKELSAVSAWVKKNTLEKFGPVVSVPAELVFELAFEGLALSTRHKSGIALRFPRVKQWRNDKKVEEIDTLDSLRKLLG
jgi:DNA ligase-1